MMKNLIEGSIHYNFTGKCLPLVKSFTNTSALVQSTHITTTDHRFFNHSYSGTATINKTTRVQKFRSPTNTTRISPITKSRLFLTTIPTAHTRSLIPSSTLMLWKASLPIPTIPSIPTKTSSSKITKTSLMLQKSQLLFQVLQSLQQQ